MSKLISWDGVMKGALSLPGVKVDKNTFLISAFAPYGNSEQLLSSTPIKIYSPEIVNKIANNVIKNHTNKVTLASAAAGIPGGLAMLGTVPVDLAQYFWNFLIMAQKLAYVYGWPDLRDENNNLGDGAQAVLTIFVGVAMGVNGANAILKEVAEQAARTLAKRIVRQALTKTTWYPIIKKIASYIGIKITKDMVGKGVAKVVPIVGALVSGGLTYATFKPMAKKLQKELNVNFDLYLNNESIACAYK